jgi:uncharacterized protein (TIGR02996 family)
VVTRESLLAAVGLDPDDDAPRLVFADWLEDNGEPERAEFVRLQMALARMAIDAPERFDAERRESELLDAHRDDWLKELPTWARKEEPFFRRGFMAELSLTEKRFLTKADELFAVTPLEGVRLRRVDRSLGPLSDSPHLSRLRKLDLTRNVLGTEGVDRLGAAGAANLTELVLDENNLTSANVCRVLRAKGLPRLERVSLRRTLVFHGCLVELAGTPEASQLRALNLYDNRVRDGGVQALASSPHLANLTDLNLGATSIGADGVTALAGSPMMARLTRLVLGKCFGLAPAQALAASRHRLAELDLSYTETHADGIAALANSPASAHLRRLDLLCCQVGDAGAEALAASEHLAGLVWLSLSHSGVGQDGAAALARSPHLGKLQFLDLRATNGARQASRQLKERFGDRVRLL